MIFATFLAITAVTQTPQKGPDATHPTPEQVAEAIESRYQDLVKEIEREVAAANDPMEKARLEEKGKARLADAEGNPRKLLKLRFADLESKGAMGLPMGKGKGDGASSSFLSPDDTVLKVRIVGHRGTHLKEPGGVFVRVVGDDGKMVGTTYTIIRSKLDDLADGVHATIDFPLYNLGPANARLPKRKSVIPSFILKPLDVKPGIEHWIASRKSNNAASAKKSTTKKA